MEKRRRFSVILSLISGIIIALSCTIIILNPNIFGVAKNQTLPTLILASITLIFACIVIFGAFLTYNRVDSGPLVVLVFSILSLVIGGVLFLGIVIGFILGIVGAIFGFLKD